MWTATLLARYKCAGEKMLIIVKYGFYTIEPIFPNTEKYTNSNKDVEIPTVVKNEIIRTALRVVRLAEVGTNIPFYDIIKMKKILLG